MIVAAATAAITSASAKKTKRSTNPFRDFLSEDGGKEGCTKKAQCFYIIIIFFFKRA
jgi:hypothetical protein